MLHNTYVGQVSLTDAEICFTVSAAESSPADDKDKSTRETAAHTDVEAEKAQHTTRCNKDLQSKRHIDMNMQHTSDCKLFNIPRTGLYEYFLGKVKVRGYLATIRKQLIEHKGKVQCGTDVLLITSKNLGKLIKTLDGMIDNIQSPKNGKKRIANRLSSLCKISTDFAVQQY